MKTYTRSDSLGYDKYEDWKLYRRFDIAHALTCFAYDYNCMSPVIGAIQAKLDSWQFSPGMCYHYDSDQLESSEREYYDVFVEKLGDLV